MTPNPSPSDLVPSIDASCETDRLCKQLLDLGVNGWIAEGGYWVIIKPLRILAIIAVAMLIRFLIARAISKLVTTTSNTAMPSILKPLHEKVPPALLDTGTVFPERRRQRAEAIGSVLRSFVTAIVLGVATLMILGELGFNVAPLLASAGIVGVALGFGAQSLVKDVLAGLFMLIEDQYGVGDTVDLGEAIGVVESVGLRVTTVRDGRGVLWYIRNGEVIRVGNKSQGWAMVVIDMPIGFVNSEEATAVLREAAAAVAADPELATGLLEPPDVIGVEQVTVDGAVIRTVAKTTADGQLTVSRELRRRLTEALETSGIAERIAAARLFPRPASPPAGGADAGRGGAT
ncbi:small conductance mechanosensitive channel [Catenuloplanes nepalensis]|uniref:Small conductance mechanosensitive channel n=1 Tax=Catenuloplanes nepalensis TaxID=587533 RepID=A0ABT9N845_9ACTN|nr:small conductance mechanosensitive channel [Catenuloplanes nepalensis]